MDEDWLRELEESLLKPEMRRDAEALSKLLADDFHELGASGQVYDKAVILAALPDELVLESYVISDFIVTELDIYVAMLNYRLETRHPGDETPLRRSGRRCGVLLTRAGRCSFTRACLSPNRKRRDTSPRRC
jgi:hypothetical protein